MGAYYVREAVENGEGDVYKDKWEKGVVNKTKICTSSVRTYIQMYEFVSMYHKLMNLKMSYTSLFKMKDEITDMFTLCDAIASQWKE